MLLCDYAVKLTLTPGQIVEHDVRSLRIAGWNDEQVHLAVQVIGYFNYINRVADGLQVDLEDWMTLSHEDWIQRKARYR